jgi:acyl-[acyl-carrier-protein]-phospholipid O-acyltransferase/long-chain-fatty-acid--[acyl-carrier-protein] ligase
MLGYLKAARPGEIQPPQDGWYDTGDLVDVDDEGYVTILGRAKRFAKIAGEMVSLSAIETLAAEIWPEAQHAVLAVADARRGEQLLLVTTEPLADRAALQARAKAKGVPELWLPRSILAVDKMPLLGTGKIDYPAVTRLVEERTAAVA